MSESTTTYGDGTTITYGSDGSVTVVTPASGSQPSQTVTYTASDMVMPTLQMDFNTEVDVVPVALPTASGSSGPQLQQATDTTPFSVSMVALRTIEQTLLEQSQAMVNAYGILRGDVESAIASPSIYGQQVTEVETTTQNPITFTTTSYTVPDTAIQQAAEEFAAVINPAMEELMHNIADSAELLGQFTASVIRAGNAYAYADQQSEFPSADGTGS